MGLFVQRIANKIISQIDEMMMSITKDNLSNCFYFLCTLFAFVMTMWATSEYLKNEDVIEISYRSFNSYVENGQYPEMSLCFANPYDDSKFPNDGKFFNSSIYHDFLHGKRWDEDLIELNYDNVTIDLQDYLIDTCLMTTKSRKCFKMNKIDTIVFPSPLGILKCFSIHGRDLEYNDKKKVNIDEAMIAINNSIFPNGLRPKSGQFFVKFHHPYQLVRAIYTTFYDWHSRENLPPTYYSMQFHIKAVEKLRRREDGNEPCYDWKNYDDQTREDVMLAVGCRPPYWRSKYNHPFCSNSEQMEKILLHNQAKLYQNDEFQKVVPPCLEFKKIDVEFDEDPGDQSKNEVSKDFYDHCADIAGGKDNWFIIHVHYWASIDFKEIKQVRAYTTMSLLGNASGYIGFLVGCSMSELPSLIFWLHAKTKQMYDRSM